MERGRTIADRFVIEDRLGEGGMGKVFRARQINAFGRMVAIKVIREDEGADATLREMFENEGAAHARLSHPNVAQLYEFGHEKGLLYIASQLVEGLNLRDVLDRAPGRRLPPGHAATVAAQILRGLGAAHGAGLVHRDMKPENVFLSWIGNALVGDFGLAKSYQPGRTPSMSGGLKGTPLYIPPEVLRGQAWTYRSDLWAVGLLFWEMLTGNRLIDGAILEAIFVKILGLAEVPSLASAGITVSPGLEAWFRRLLAQDPLGRFDDARAALSAGLPHLQALGLSTPEDTARFLAELPPLPPAPVEPQDAAGPAPGGTDAGFGASAVPVAVADRPTVPVTPERQSMAGPPPAAPPLPAVVVPVASHPTLSDGLRGEFKAAPPRSRRWVFVAATAAVIGLVALGIGLVSQLDGRAPRDTTVADRVTAPDAKPAAPSGTPVAVSEPEPVVPDAAPSPPDASVAPTVVEAESIARSMMEPVFVPELAMLPESKPEPPDEPAHRRRVTGTGTLVVTVGRKSWALVTANGRSLGQSPVNVELPAGSYSIVLENQDLPKRERVRVEIKPGETTRVERSW